MISKRNDDSEQRALLAILLSLVVFWTFNAFMSPPPAPEPPAVVEAGATDEPSTSGEAGAVTPAPAAVEAVPERDLKVSSTDVEATLSSKGGGLRTVILPKQEGAYQVTPVWDYAKQLIKGDAPDEWKPYGDAPGPEQLLSDKATLVSAGVGEDFAFGDFLVDGQGPWTATRTTPEGLRITQTWSTTDNPTLFAVELRFENAGGQTVEGPLWVGSADHFEGEASRYASTSRPEAVVAGDYEQLLKLEDAEDGPVTHEGEVSWFGIGDRYFLAAAVPEDRSWGQLRFAEVEGDAARHGSFLVREQPLAAGEVEVLRMQVYMGSKDLDTLRALGNDLPEAVDLGFFGFFAGILLWLLRLLHGLVGNWGAAIILLTLMVKGLFWPLTRRSFVSGRKMQALSPKLNEIRDTYKDDPQAAGQAQMKLFAEEGVNPLSGCLPMLVQMPVWFALYSVLLYTSDVYHAEFLYLRDLSSVDPVGALPALVGVLMIIQQMLTPMSPNMDPVQQKMMRAMPLIFVFFMFIFPSGLALYILINTILSIVQMWLINRTIPIPVANAEPNVA
ncbi:MAG: membrane protein insertase YidC [Alphaproteobacteria bacterium]|nr:membrane protein insertase YidC [Alphaproteobacteria bacterium]